MKTREELIDLVKVYCEQLNCEFDRDAAWIWAGEFELSVARGDANWNDAND